VSVVAVIGVAISGLVGSAIEVRGQGDPDRVIAASGRAGRAGQAVRAGQAGRARARRVGFLSGSRTSEVARRLRSPRSMSEL